MASFLISDDNIEESSLDLLNQNNNCLGRFENQIQATSFDYYDVNKAVRVIFFESL